MEKESERRKALRELIADHDPCAILLEGEEFDGGIVGITQDDRVAYSYDRLVESLMAHNGWTMEESIEWIDVNTARAIPYMGPKAPVLIYDIDVDELGEGPKPDESEDGQ